jgi:hypothetical protein
LEIIEKQGNEHVAAVTYGQLGLLYNRQNKKDIALDFYQKSLTIFQKNKDDYNVAKVQNLINKLERPT